VEQRRCTRLFDVAFNENFKNFNIYKHPITENFLAKNSAWLPMEVK
jgi:hypothetical protein